MAHGEHKNPTLCWHPPAELSGWARAEAERRGGRGALSDLLTEALTEYRRNNDPANHRIVDPKENKR
jgi:hypothetical protein